MSKSLPSVVNVTVPEVGAVQRHQIEFVDEAMPCDGSPASLVAPALDAESFPVAPESGRAFAKSSFAGRLSSWSPVSV